MAGIGDTPAAGSRRCSASPQERSWDRLRHLDDRHRPGTHRRYAATQEAHRPVRPRPRGRRLSAHPMPLLPGCCLAALELARLQADPGPDGGGDRGHRLRRPDRHGQPAIVATLGCVSLWVLRAADDDALESRRHGRIVVLVMVALWLGGLQGDVGSLELVGRCWPAPRRVRSLSACRMRPSWLPRSRAAAVFLPGLLARQRDRLPGSEQGAPRPRRVQRPARGPVRRAPRSPRAQPARGAERHVHRHRRELRLAYFGVLMFYLSLASTAPASPSPCPAPRRARRRTTTPRLEVLEARIECVSAVGPGAGARRVPAPRSDLTTLRKTLPPRS